MKNTEAAKRSIMSWVESNGSIIDEVNDNLWDIAEVALEEYRSCAYLKEILVNAGFRILSGPQDMPTSFIAEWGSGHPCIGYLGEYDALPGQSQDKGCIQKPRSEGAPGHACGHCTLGAGILGGVLALKEQMEKENLQGTVRFYGCPAEEILVGKVRMSRSHLFDDCDAALSWHPNDTTYVWARKSVSLLSIHYNFKGKAAHAGRDPWNGRSALDAAELMNVGANYLREHIPNDWKLHYVITNGGVTPNTVPDQAQIWYMLRANDRSQTESLHQRISRIAKGAAMMTDTEVSEEIVAGCYSYLPNITLADVILDCIKDIGAPKWTEEDYRFAQKLTDQLPSANVRDKKLQFGLKDADVCEGLVSRVYDKLYTEGVLGAATDVADVSWQIPVGCFGGASAVVGAPNHSWFYTAACGSGIGHRAARTAAQTLALVGYRLMTEPDLLSTAKAEHLQNLKGEVYQCPLS